MLAHAHSWVKEIYYICNIDIFCGDTSYSRGYSKETICHCPDNSYSASNALDIALFPRS